MEKVTRLLPATALLLGVMIACRPAPSTMHSMASCAPPSTTLLGGIDLDRLRASRLYSKLPPAATTALETYREARYLMLAWDGRSMLIIARGSFRQPPPGATMLASDLAIAGDPELLQAAAAQYRTGKTGAPGLVTEMDSVADGNAIWVVARGGAVLPFGGNAGNLSRLLRNAEYATLAARLGSRIDLSATVLGQTPDAARQVEETVRAAITMAGAGQSRGAGLPALLKSIQLARSDRTVSATLSTSVEEAQRLFRSMAP